MNRNTLISILIIFILLVFRTILGIQFNFCHNDYTQIYLMGLENALSGNWSYWGPDVVWSQTRLPGALQGLLAGVPLKLTKSMYAPIVFSNILTTAGLVLLAFYSKKRLPKLSIHFLLVLYLLLPLTLRHGVVLLNTAYLIFSGALLFISIFELFIFRDNLVLKKASYYFFLMGFSLMFTFQLHLTWVTCFPYLLVLSYFEWKRSKREFKNSMLLFVLGALIAGITLIPTIIKYPTVIFSNSDGNLAFHANRFLSVFDLFGRYFSYAIYDVRFKHNIYELAISKSILIYVLIIIVKLFSLIQFGTIWVTYYFIRKNKELRKLMLLFGLTLFMALMLFVFSNKHLSVRTYILLYPLPIFMSLYAYNFLFEKKYIKNIFYISLVFLFATFLGLGITNFQDRHSFKSVEGKIKKAIELKDPYQYAERRVTKMDPYD